MKLDMTYKLVPVPCDGRIVLTPVPCDNLAECMENRRVDETKVGGATISTVFLALDHRFTMAGPPILFETMVFDVGGEHNGYQERCSTWDEARAMHARVVAMVRTAQQPTEGT